MLTDTKKLRNIAAAALLIGLLWALYNDIKSIAAYGQASINVWMVLDCVAYIVAIWAVYTGKDKLLIIFSVVKVALCLTNIKFGIEWVNAYLSYGIPVTASVLYIIFCVLSGAAFLLFAIAVLNNRAAKICGIVAAALYVLGSLLYNFVGPMSDPSFAPLTVTGFFLTLLDILLYAVIFAITGFVLDGKAAQEAKAHGSVPVSATSCRIEKLCRLKELYDSGVITSTEFEEKKKQIIGE